MPARPVLEVGDSLGIDLGWGLTDELSGSKHRLIAVAVGDTGLAEPSYYDWPAQLSVDLRLYHPGTVIVFLGANDVESFYTTDRFSSVRLARLGGVLRQAGRQDDGRGCQRGSEVALGGHAADGGPELLLGHGHAQRRLQGRGHRPST